MQRMKSHKSVSMRPVTSAGIAAATAASFTAYRVELNCLITDILTSDRASDSKVLREVDAAWICAHCHKVSKLFSVLWCHPPFAFSLLFQGESTC